RYACPTAGTSISLAMPEDRQKCGYLEEVLGLLLDNACDSLNERVATSEVLPSEWAPSIQVDMKDLDGALEISVHDNGTGLTPEKIPFLGTPFFTTKSFQAGHMGLGHLRALMLLHEIGPCEIRFTAEVGRFHVLARIIR
ncbi:MAG: ATP-binding protein, partial [Bdellovibrionota bacterium]